MSPASPVTLRAFNTFDVKPSPAPLAGQIDVDELVIDWGDVPAGTLAQIYWPAVNAAQVLKLANARYASHTLAVADTNTVSCLTTRRLSYVPIPANAGAGFAGLLSVDLPAPVGLGRQFSITVRRVTSYTPPPAAVPPPVKSPPVHSPLTQSVRSGTSISRLSPASGDEPNLPGDGRPRRPVLASKTWRTYSGAFQVNVATRTAASLLPLAANTLAIFKWRLSVLPKTDRWYPVVVRYIAYLSEQINANGGDAGAITPSPTGLPGKYGSHGAEHGGGAEPKSMHRHLEGKIRSIVYDCFGDFDGFWLQGCEVETFISARERRIEGLVLRALEARLRVEAITREGDDHLLQLKLGGSRERLD
jgi:hypothetical protein